MRVTYEDITRREYQLVKWKNLDSVAVHDPRDDEWEYIIGDELTEWPTEWQVRQDA